MNTPPPPPPPSSSATPPPPPNGQPAKSGSKVLVIILCIVLGFFVLVGGCVAACVYYAAKKTKEYSAASEKNPQLAAVTLIATMTPDIQIVSKDENAGTITLRNKKTGEVTTIDTSQYTTKNIGKAVEQFSKGLAVPTPTPESDSSSSTTTAQAEREEAIENREGDEPAEKISVAQSAALNNTLKKFPPAVTAYPGGTTVEATLNSFGGVTAGSYGFTTKDSTEKVVNYYEEKLKSAGYTIATKSSDTNQYGQVTQLVAVHSDPEASFTISAEARAHDVRATINIGQKN